MRILHLIYDDPANPWVGGGGAVRVRELYARLAGRVEAEVVTGSYPGASGGVFEGVRYRRLGRESPYAWSRATFGLAASALLRRARYDAAVVDFSAYTPIVVPRGRPVGVTVHHLTGPSARERWGAAGGSLVGLAERRLLRRAHIFSATSAATHLLLTRILPPGSTIVRVGAGVDERFYAVDRQEADYLLYFGRLDWFQKGLDVLVDAFARIAATFPALTLRIAGRGRDTGRIAGAIEAAGLGKRVTLLGPVSDAERLRLLAGARLMLMPSRFEGFGMVAAEAMAAGVPLVASSAGSLPEVVDAPSGGLLVPPEDAGALAASASTLLADDAARDELSRTARRSAERFRWHIVAEDHLAFLRRIAATH